MITLRRPPSVLPDVSPSSGRSNITSAFANRNSRKIEARVKPPISPLEGEMSGRREERGREIGLSHIFCFDDR
ncbi:MAG: hypothetical protein EOR30_02460 [Mesorhizobium sp.]|nr:hypothetical protein EOA78_05275 [Mesorhizobium sp. M5C.F.Cr.IN.023.01.1.1]RWF80882.1 MAG: hypothetical protein EOQ36_31970 [Mesorhizobium sp.]RWF88646.1 MAG: hypothetical protein EOQ45_31980 [Mesorhizobium sp.]RWI38534.1 MAG: hypothetical protein EOR14_20920 [Mesorhizobium sp.]RWI49437.1 MAG: hypothetical protein EOR15_10300 [Mesorhizobium sp.]